MYRNYNIHASPSRPHVGSSIASLLLAVLAILTMVWVIVYLGSNSLERVRLPEEARLTNFVIVQQPDTAFLGVQLFDQQSKIALSGKKPEGVMISQVINGSPADRAGLLPKDIIYRVENTKIESATDLNRVLMTQKAGETVQMTIFRDTADRVVHVRLGSNSMASFVAARSPVEKRPTWLGIDIQPVDNVMLKQLSLPDNHGVIVSWVHPNSPAQISGIQQGDIIRRINNTRIRNAGQLASLLNNQQPGDSLNVTLFQQGNVKNIKVVLSTPPPPGTQPPAFLPEAEVEVEAAWLGLDILPLTKAEAEELGLPGNIKGMVVDGVATGPGTDAGFQVGDVIVAVNGHATPNINRFGEATEGAIGAVVDVIRFGRHLYISIPPPGQEAANQNNQPSLQQIVYNNAP